MGAVEDRLVLTLADAKVLLGITGTDQDALLTLLLSAAKQAADLYLNNPFTDDDGAPLEIPNVIKLGVINWMRTNIDAPPSGAIYVKTGDIAVRYADGAAFSETTLEHWTPYRLHPKKAAGSTSVSWVLGHVATDDDSITTEESF